MFLKKSNIKDIKIKRVTNEKMINYITKNFFHEKKLIEIVKQNNSNDRLNNNRNFINLYKSLVKKFLINKDCLNVNIPINKRDFHLYLIIYVRMTNINFHNLIKIKLINPPKVIKEFILEEFREFKSRKISKSNIILNFSKRIKIPSNCQRLIVTFITAH